MPLDVLHRLLDRIGHEPQVEVLQHGRIGAGVSEPHVFQPDRVGDPIGGRQIGAMGEGRRVVLEPRQSFGAVQPDAAQETDLATAKLLAEIEPPALGKDINFAIATRADLQAYLNDLRTAETNATAAMPRFDALVKKERDDVESLSRSLNISDDLSRNLLTGVDNRQTIFSAFVSRMMAAQAELYRALAGYIAILVEQYGNYTVKPNGQFEFRDSSVVVGFNVAANAVKAAAKRVAELDVEGKQLTKSQQKGWERFRSTK